MGLYDFFNRPAQPVTGLQTAGSTYQVQKARADIKLAANKIASKIGQRNLLINQYEEAAARKDVAERQLGVNDLVQILLQKTSDFARQQAKLQIEDIVSQALNVVFGGNHKFIIELNVKASQPVADYFLDDGTTVTKLEKPDYDRGGGKVDVISLALRLAVGELYGVQGPLFLDEVGKHISAEYSQNVAYFLKEYSANFNRQIVLITHNTTLAEIGEVSLEVSRKNGISEVKTI
jgi:DNA repair exonuclease SbcCD ATPase subunit